MKATKPYYAIISAERTRSQVENDSATELLNARLKELGFICHPVFGCYNGQTEKSFLVNLGTDARFHGSNVLTIMELGRKLRQESVLLIDNEEQAVLKYCETNKTEKLGLFQRVTKEDAVANKAYTHIGDEYFICK